MIESKYLPGQIVPEFDEAVSRVVHDYGFEGGGNDMLLAIENFDGIIYRVLTATGLGAYIHATSELSKLGLKDLLANSAGKNGYDSWFVTTADIAIPVPAPSVAPIARTDPASDILGQLDALDEVPETERESLVLSRVGQGEFRAQLIAYWQACAVTGLNCLALLKASHIKPWRDSSNTERLSIFNGLLLSPNLDAAFDAGFVSFDQNGKILLSEAISGAHSFALHINAKMRINSKLLRPEHQEYLEHHRNEVFLR